MSTPKLTKSYGKIVVRQKGKTADTDSVSVSFGEYDAYYEALRKLRENDKVEILDKFWGYALYADASEALATIDAMVA